MSKTTNITLFPELLNLKQTINQLQGQYVDAKPNLNVALAGLAVTDVRQSLTTLAESLALPLDGNLPDDVRVCYEEAAAALGNLHKTLTTEGFIIGLTGGFGVEQVFRDTGLPMRNLMVKAGEVSQTMETMPGGYTRMLSQHVADRFADMLVVLTNATFEALDNYQLPISPGDIVSSFFSEISEAAKAVSFLPQMVRFREMIGLWLKRWASRPDLAEALASWMDVASVRLSEPRTVSRYKAGDVLVRLIMAAGKVATVRLSNGRLPVGMQLTAEGNIVVSDPGKLFASYFDGLEISGTTDQDLTFRVKVPEIVIGADQPAEYTVSEPLAISDMTVGHVLAAPYDPDGTIVEAQVLGGKFPPGVRFHTANGELAVADLARLKEGSYPIRIVTIDEVGGETEHEIEILIGTGQGGGSRDPIKISVALGEFELPLTVGQVLATVTAEGKSLAVSQIRVGSTPKGIELQPDASLMVMDLGQTLGSFNFTFIAQDATGIVYEVTVGLSFVDRDNQTGGGDGSEIKVVELAYTEIAIALEPGAIMAEIHVNGLRPRSWKLFSGGLPEGVEIDQNGAIIAVDPVSIKEGFAELVIDAEMMSLEVYRIFLDLGFVNAPRIDIRPDRIMECEFAVMLPVEPGTVIGELNPFALKLGDISPLLEDLPQGLFVNQIGQLVATQPSFLTVGTHAFAVRLQDSDGRHMQLDVTLRVGDLRGAMLPAARLIMRLGQFDHTSVVGRILATISVPSDRIQAWAVMAGDLPPGLTLAPGGALWVSDPSELITGRFAFVLRIQGVSGSMIIAEIHLEITGRRLFPGTNRRYYSEYLGIKLPVEAGTRLGMLEVEKAPVTDCVVIGGTLPAGIEVKDGGEVVATGPAVINRSHFDVLISCAVRGRQGSELVLRLGFEGGSEVGIVHTQDFRGLLLPFTDGQLIATITADGAPLQACVLADGTLPQGTQLDSMGRITAIPKVPRLEGISMFAVSGRTADGALHIVRVSMEFVSSPSGNVTVFHQDLGVQKLDQPEGIELGLIRYEGISLRNVSLNQSILPPGTVLDGFGSLRVGATTALRGGEFHFEILAQDAAGVSYHGFIKIFFV